jgi:hypothetical protein
VTAGVTLQAAARLTLNSTLQISATTRRRGLGQRRGSDFIHRYCGRTVEGRRRELPITGRDAELSVHTGRHGFQWHRLNGTRTGATNVTTDGITASNRIDSINTSGVVTSSGLLGDKFSEPRVWTVWRSTL